MERRHSIGDLIRDQSGAVASTYAMALVGLIAAAGVGYDFARLATMSTELHNAADQAALAAATQLTGKSDSITNAQYAANNLVANKTLLANDTNDTAVTIAAFVYYKTAADAEADDETKATTDPLLARFVKVKVATRRVNYAFTPIGNVFSSAATGAAATAGLGSAVCKVPPMMICNPVAENSDTFNVADYIGKGILLKGQGGDNAWAPGNFGFLDAGNGANDLKQLMGYVNPPGDCVSVTEPTTKPGQMTSVTDEFNTRFDIYNGGDNLDCYSSNKCPPSDNARKDLVQNKALTDSSTLDKNDCDIKKNPSDNSQGQGKGGNGWRVSVDPYRPTSANACSTTYPCSELGNALPDAMGYPRDICHAHSETGSCNSGVDGRIGDGTWDVQAYWKVNYGGAAYASQVNGKTAPTRYDVYKWERTNASPYRQFTQGGNGAGNTYTDFKKAMCRAPTAPGPTTPDRRVFPVAVVNCHGLTGASKVTPLDWIDVFLVEPSVSRKVGNTVYTKIGDFYVEVIGRTSTGDGASAQFVRRDKPFLVR